MESISEPEITVERFVALIWLMSSSKSVHLWLQLRRRHCLRAAFIGVTRIIVRCHR